MKIYVAGALFSYAEREFNLWLARKLQNQGHQTFLPQVMCEDKSPKKIFKTCLKGVSWCEMVVAVLEGAMVDDGTAFECGLAYKRKPIFGLRTDFRKQGDEPKTGLNLMLAYGCTKLFDDIDELAEGIAKYARKAR